MAARTFSRTGAELVRTLMPSSAVSGMTAAVVPACSLPMVTTTGSWADISRETIVWSRSTSEAAITTGSTAASGLEPWPPRPKSLTVMESVAPMTVPGRVAMRPTGPGPTCEPRITSGRGKRSKSPSSTISRAP